MVKDVSLAFCSITFYKNICVKMSIPNLSQCWDIGQNSDGRISHFRISGQFIIKKNCHSCRNSHNTDMKLEQVTTPDKRNKATLKISDVGSMSVSYNFIDFFPTYDQFAVIRKLDSRHVAYKIYILINSNLLPYKT